MTNEEHYDKSAREEKSYRQTWRILKVVITIICLTPGMWLLLSHYKDGDLEIYLEYNAEHTAIYASKYTWWGLGADKHYEIKAIKGQWHIRELNGDKKFSAIYNFAIFSHKNSKERPPTYYDDDY